MKISINRTSIAAGDDVEDHDETRRFERQMDAGAAVWYIVASGYLPRMSDDACWIVEADGAPLAVISGTGQEVLFARDPRSELSSCFTSAEPSLDFKYQGWGTAWETFGKVFPGKVSTSYELNRK